MHDLEEQDTINIYAMEPEESQMDAQETRNRQGRRQRQAILSDVPYNSRTHRAWGNGHRNGINNPAGICHGVAGCAIASRTYSLKEWLHDESDTTMKEEWHLEEERLPDESGTMVQEEDSIVVYSTTHSQMRTLM